MGTFALNFFLLSKAINIPFFRMGGSHKQPSMASDLRLPAESDNESMADYADGVGEGT